VGPRGGRQRECVRHPVRRHARAVYNRCFRLTASWSAAEDLTQTTFLHAWRKCGAVRLEHDSARPWLLAVATNMARNHRRGLRGRLRLAERPSTWKAPVGPNGIVRAFDADGAQLIAVSEFTRLNDCHVAPDGTGFPTAPRASRPRASPACGGTEGWHRGVALSSV
jgi:DNA-directed RNA polymerase specialized sigma24 family protein